MWWSRFSPSIHFSPWPLFLGMTVGGLASSTVLSLKTGLFALAGVAVAVLMIVVVLWSRDMSWEARSGEYGLQTFDNFKLSFSLFVFSEIMLFVSFFWTLLHFAFSPSILVGHVWPPAGISVISPGGVPLFNTVLLVSSGVTVTWFHHLLVSGDMWESVGALSVTLVLGIVFLFNQGMEFLGASFSLSDGVYGSVFFVLTGLHGLHVFLGLVLLLIGGVRLFWGSFSCYVHVSVELAIWYWHFVDCVWLVVYSLVYFWGS